MSCIYLTVKTGNAPRSSASVGVPQQVVQRGFGASLCVHALDDHGARQTVFAIGRRQSAGYDDRAGRYPAVEDLIALPIVDAGALADEHAHRNHGAGFDDHALDDLRAGADEAVILDDGGTGLQRLEDAADADSAGQVHVLAGSARRSRR